MSETTKSIHSRSGEATRPDLPPKREAEICGLSLAQILELRQALEDARPGPEYERAWDNYVKATSVPVTDAAIMVGCRPADWSKLAHYSLIPVFKHRERWRMWMETVRYMQDSDPSRHDDECWSRLIRGANHLMEHPWPTDAACFNAAVALLQQVREDFPEDAQSKSPALAVRCLADALHAAMVLVPPEALSSAVNRPIDLLHHPEKKGGLRIVLPEEGEL